ncbi:MAG: YkgJ family cysteine cluster protein [Ilumatobacteraceae bacterium]
MTEKRDLAAGDFSSWLDEILEALRGEHGSSVPCGTCTACCTSSQFILIEPDETDTLARIPTELLFPAPRLPRGHVLLGYDERGHCPMLIDGKCTIYDDRPRTCRTYDCRIFPAAGLEPDEDAKAEITEQVRRWKFSYSDDVGRTLHDSVRAAATYLRVNAVSLPEGAVPKSATQLAVAAIEAHDAFLMVDEGAGATSVVDPEPEAVRLALTRRTLRA